uniref:Uncharacterized protein n=1 Tax=Candidatus Kentrum sp. TC TaxID=2126339 RepID=A0A450Y9V0_9GAMM|nr:MAG: hypothetical protein BECKTC1821D_GA0114238_100428 [Candidatus Kentron sp. TC]VFK54255.1 MAG: hypothetical protein BECKTC1821F_GA0114240_100494 [Candidatus Kentron sp. TC]
MDESSPEEQTSAGKYQEEVFLGAMSIRSRIFPFIPTSASSGQFQPVLAIRVEEMIVVGLETDISGFEKFECAKNRLE